MVWIIGEYGERIDNALDLLTHFANNFNTENKTVQHAILNAVVKLYLKLGDPAEELVMSVLKSATEESDSPDLRNRGYIYWRMLATNPDEAKAAVLASKPPIS